MRVLFIENTGNKSAGAYHSMVALIKFLRNYGVESYVAVSDKADGLDLLEKNKIPYFKMRACAYTWIISNRANKLERLKMPLKYIFSKLSSVRLIAYAKENKIDLVHENNSACYIGFFVSKFLGIPHIWHIREFLEEDFNASFWNKQKAISFMNDSEAIIAISDAIKEKYRCYIRQEIMHRIYNGITINDYYLHSNRQLLKGSCNILCVGRVCEGKGQADVIRSMVVLKERYAFMPQLYIAGVYTEEYKKLIMRPAENAQIAKNIHFLGQCDNMRELYSKMDILCMASHKEAFGRVTVEAMLSGMLVIGADSGGTAEIISENETGFLYRTGDVDHLAEVIHKVTANAEQVATVAKRGQEHAKIYFDAERNAKEIYELYQKLMEKSDG